MDRFRRRSLVAAMVRGGGGLKTTAMTDAQETMPVVAHHAASQQATRPPLDAPLLLLWPRLRGPGCERVRSVDMGYREAGRSSILKQ